MIKRKPAVPRMCQCCQEFSDDVGYYGKYKKWLCEGCAWSAGAPA